MKSCRRSSTGSAAWRLRSSLFAVSGLLAATLTVAVAARAQVPACADCHDLDSDPILATPHGDFECADCHVGFDEELHPDELAAPECAECHDDVVRELIGSVHRDATLEGELAPALACATCHGLVHSLPAGTEPDSPVYPGRLASTCGGCHADPALAERFRFHVVQPLAAYLTSVHAQAVAEGDEGASCSDCHGSHGILPAADPNSSVSRRRVPETCGVCHTEIAETYRQSVHGQAAAHGIRESPVCTDCHGEHRILSPAEEGSPVFATNIPKLTCGRCHADLRLAEKFGLDPAKVPAYADSYHGLAASAGTLTVAHCGSCHGIHDIQPSSDPISHVHEDNLGETCGACHPGAGATFAIGPVHILPTDPDQVAVFWIRRLYLWLIVVTVGGMLLHNGLDLYRKARTRRVRAPTAGTARSERLSVAFRLTHALLALSFAVLVYTGFALKYPESWWAAPLLQWESDFGFRGGLHRVAAILLLGATVFHVVHLLVSRSARACIAGMRPSSADWRELKERIGFLLGRSEHPPRARRIGYPEKIEYLAVIWGTTLMALTGFVLWFESPVLRWMPKWVLDIATVVHFYEAVLATLAILVWHFYFVIFDPRVYPMDPAWLTGHSAPERAAEHDETP